MLGFLSLPGVGPNIVFSLQGMNLHELTAGLTTYHHYLAEMMCNPPLPRCYVGECDYCPRIEKLKEHLITLLDENSIDSITYEQWTDVDCSTLETMTMSSDEFADSLCEKLDALRSHSFIATQQSRFYEECRASLKPGEVVVSADFSEKYAFVLQEAAQGFQWNNQSTINPFVVYFKESLSLSHDSCIVISDCLQHSTILQSIFSRKNSLTS